MTDPALPQERRSVVSLGLLYAFRMLGLFMVLPVLALYGDAYQYSTPALLGLALGAYGCSQALLQIPFGLWSDRWGRKPVIAVGLVLFALGSVIAANADTVYGLIAGRFLQGGGAVAGAIMAMVGDLTSDRNRTKAMAGIGASIGLSFSLALILGPVVSRWGGLSAIFWLTAGFALIGLLILIWAVPTPQGAKAAELTTNRRLVAAVLRHRELLRLDVGIFALHFVLMASFVVLPGLLVEVLGVAGEHHWWIYLPLLVGAFVMMLPFMLLAEKKRRIKSVFVGAVSLLGVMQLGWVWWHGHVIGLLAGLFCFFVAFNLLEATLPSLLSKQAPTGSRGTANGVYSTSQFLGAFLGGTLGGVAAGWGGPEAVFGLSALVVGGWWCLAWFMVPPRPLSSVQVTVPERDREEVLSQLWQLPGVADVKYVEAERAAHLEVDHSVFRRDSVAELGL